MDIKVIGFGTDIDEIERLRSLAFYNDENFRTPIFQHKYDNNEMIIIAAYLKGKLVGALYFAPFMQNGYVDQLFVDPKYQNSSYHVGTTLLNYLDNHIIELGEYFNLLINKIYIDYNSQKSKKVYLNAGYKHTQLDGTLVKRLG